MPPAVMSWQFLALILWPCHKVCETDLCTVVPIGVFFVACLVSANAASQSTPGAAALQHKRTLLLLGVPWEGVCYSSVLMVAQEGLLLGTSCSPSLPYVCFCLQPKCKYILLNKNVFKSMKLPKLVGLQKQRQLQALLSFSLWLLPS